MQRNLASRWRSHGHVAACLLLLAAVGCGKGTASVSGQVIYQGRPLAGGAVTFYGENNWMQSAWIDTGGKYTITQAPAGAVKVTVVPSEPRDSPASAGKIKHSGKAGEVPKQSAKKEDAPPAGKSVALPGRYKDPDQSGLSYTLVPGTQTINIELKP
jgi:hypothetical protein